LEDKDTVQLVTPYPQLKIVSFKAKIHESNYKQLPSLEKAADDG